MDAMTSVRREPASLIQVAHSEPASRVALNERVRASQNARIHDVSTQTMQATVLYGARDVRFEDVAAPTILEPTDVIVGLPATCICGSDNRVRSWRSNSGPRISSRNGVTRASSASRS
jgi:hypothetical protein